MPGFNPAVLSNFTVFPVVPVSTIVAVTLYVEGLSPRLSAVAT